MWTYCVILGGSKKLGVSHRGGRGRAALERTGGFWIFLRQSLTKRVLNVVFIKSYIKEKKRILYILLRFEHFYNLRSERIIFWVTSNEIAPDGESSVGFSSLRGVSTSKNVARSWWYTPLLWVSSWIINTSLMKVRRLNSFVQKRKERRKKRMKKRRGQIRIR